MLEKHQRPMHAAFAQPEPGGTDDTVDLLGMLRALWRGKWWIVLFTLLGLGLGGLYVFKLAVPLYTSRSVVALINRDSQVIDLEGAIGGLSGDDATINTEAEVLRSRQLLSDLVTDLELVNDPEFNHSLLPVRPYSVAWAKERLLGPPEPPTDQEMFDETVDTVLGVLSVSNLPDSYVFNISIETRSPEKSALMANTLADLYIMDQLNLKFEATEKATNWLSSRVSVLKEELEEAERRLKEFTTSTQLVSPEALAGLNLQIKDLRSRLSDKRAEMQLIDARIDALEEARRGAGPAEIAAIAGDPALTRLADQAEAGTGSPELFESRLDQVIATARAQRARESSQVDVLERSIAGMEEQIQSQSSELVTQQQLEREVEASALIYESFLSRMKEMSVQQGLQEADARILSAAVVRPDPSAPVPSLVLALSGLLGLVAGSGFVLMREVMQNVFRTSEDLERFTGVPVLGQVPVAPTARRQRLLRYIVEKPNSAYSEAVRNLRTSILLSNVDRPPEIIMITSSVPGEGKTTQSLSLSQNLAMMGKKVLLVEADIRRRTFNEYFDIPKDHPGLVTAVTQGAPISDLVFRSEQLGMEILLGEKSQANAADFFSSQMFAGFLDRVREEYDFVILDTPPVLAVPDARVIGQLADMIIYVVHWDKTGKSEVSSGMRSLQGVNLQVNGLILSQVDPKGMRRYGHGGGYGTYGARYYNS